MAYYTRLKDLREDKDKTQNEIAEVLKIKQVVYSRYERGEREIPFHHVIKLADYYETTLDYIAGRTNIKEKTTQLKTKTIHEINNTKITIEATKNINETPKITIESNKRK